jgi:hypothetical protein
MGSKIVIYSFRLLFTNLANALRVSVGPYLIGLALGLVILAAVGFPISALYDPNFDPTAVMMSGGSAFVGILACFILLMFVSSWVAVGWHRYILLEEYPGMLPAVAGRPVWPYAWRVLLLVLVMILVAIPLGMIAGFVAFPLIGSGPPSGMDLVILVIIGIVVGSVLSWIWLRLGMVLPAVAIGRPMTMGDSWGRTASHSGAIFVAVLILAALNVGVGTLMGHVLGNNAVSFAISLIVDWITIMVGISILTTLYGVIIEGRSIS